MVDDELVDSSDCEEIEALAAQSPGYWPRVTHSLRVQRLAGTEASGSTLQIPSLVPPLASPLARLATAYPSSSSDGEEPPFKRARVSNLGTFIRMF